MYDLLTKIPVVYLINAISSIWVYIIGYLICNCINDNKKKQKIICNIFITLIAMFILSIKFIL